MNLLNTKSLRIKSGFTIVELLIVIVVIAILAAITVVAYNGIQNRANDAALQNDLKNIAKQMEFYKVDNGIYPVGNTELAKLDIKVAKSSYSTGNSGWGKEYNILYCRVAADGPDKFALVASSKSGNVFIYKSETGAATSSTSWGGGSSVNICQNAGINQVVYNDRDIFYYNGWQSYVGG